MQIIEAKYTDSPLALLLEADPSEKKINQYLPDSHCYVAEMDGEVIGVCAVLPVTLSVYELMNRVVGPRQQGIGTQLLAGVIKVVKAMGGSKLLVGAGAFGYQLTFYQRAGFRVVSVDRDFFLKNYDALIYDMDVQHKDMLRLELDLLLRTE